VNANDPLGLATCRSVASGKNGFGDSYALVYCQSVLGFVDQQTEISINGIGVDDYKGIEDRAARTVGADLDREELPWILIDAYAVAQKMLELEDCSKLFGTSETRANGWSPSQVLSNLVFGRGDLGSVGCGPTLGAEALTSPTITLGGIGARINIKADAWQTDTPGMNARHRALTLLHEMGHAYNILSIRGSGGSEIKQLDHIFPDRQDFNNTLMEVNCGVIPAIRR
jgi:hypothetical protein